MLLDNGEIYSDKTEMKNFIVGINVSKTYDQLCDGDVLKSPWLQISIDKTPVSNAVSHLSINLVTSSSPDFTNETVFPLVPDTNVTKMSRGKILYRARMPLGMLRYHRIEYVLAEYGTTLSDGQISAFRLLDVQTNR